MRRQPSRLDLPERRRHVEDRHLPLADRIRRHPLQRLAGTEERTDGDGGAAARDRGSRPSDRRDRRRGTHRRRRARAGAVRASAPRAALRPGELCRALNKRLPRDVHVLGARPPSPRFTPATTPSRAATSTRSRGAAPRWRSPGCGGCATRSTSSECAPRPRSASVATTSATSPTSMPASKESTLVEVEIVEVIEEGALDRRAHRRLALPVEDGATADRNADAGRRRARHGRASRQAARRKAARRGRSAAGGDDRAAVGALPRAGALRRRSAVGATDRRRARRGRAAGGQESAPARAGRGRTGADGLRDVLYAASRPTTTRLKSSSSGCSPRCASNARRMRSWIAGGVPGSATSWWSCS